MKKPDNTKAAHHKTPKEMRARHQKQIGGEELETIPANGPDAPEGTTIDADEAHLVHYTQEMIGFDPVTGKPTGSPSTQKMNPKAFEQAKRENGFAGYAIKVLHAPEFAKKELGEAVEGTRVVDTNYAAMQQRYEALTGEKPDENLTELQLEASIRTAEVMERRIQNATAGGEGVDLSKAPAHTAPSISTPDVAPVSTTEDAKKQVADAAREAGATANPDGTPGPGTDAGRGGVGADSTASNMAAMSAAAASKAPAAAIPPAPPTRRGPAPTGNKPGPKAAASKAPAAAPGKAE